MKTKKKKNRDRHPPRRNRRVTRRSANTYCEALGFAACRAAITTYATMILAGNNVDCAKKTSRVFFHLDELRVHLAAVPAPEYVMRLLGQCGNHLHTANEAARGTEPRHRLRRGLTDAQVFLSRAQGELQLFLCRCGRIGRFLRGGNKLQLGGIKLSVVIVVVAESGIDDPGDKSCQSGHHQHYGKQSFRRPPFRRQFVASRNGDGHK
jgi:hypothetical protein